MPRPLAAELLVDLVSADARIKELTEQVDELADEPVSLCTRRHR